MPVGSPETQSSGPQDQDHTPPYQPSDSPGEDFRGADGLWYYPDGSWHPRNIVITDGPANYSSTDNDSPVE